jgi:uncharacterized protein YerC
MTLEPVEQALSIFDAILTPHSLTNVQQLVIRGCWQGQTYSQIAETTGYDDYIRDVGFQLWRRVSQALGEKVSKSNFQVVLRRYQQAQNRLNTELVRVMPTLAQRSTDWDAGSDAQISTLSRS